MKRDWPEPPLISQRGAPNPGGSPDPAGDTDCGEACISAAVLALRGVYFSPGAMRQALRLPVDNGRTGSSDLAELWVAFGGRADLVDITWPNGKLQQRSLRHGRHYLPMLGNWIAPGLLHWVLAYANASGGYWVVDPWTVAYRHFPYAEVSRLSAGAAVLLS